MKISRKLIVEAIKGTTEDLTTIPLNRAIILLSIPMILEMSMESLFAVVDAFFVAKLGEAALTTVGLTESVMFLVYSLAIGLATAATAMVARRVGEKDISAANVAAGQAILIAVSISVLVGLGGGFFAPDILRMMGADEQVLEIGTNYTRIMFSGNVVIMLLFLLNGIFRGTGNATLALYTLVLCNGINIVLDPCLILGLGPFPKLGVTGAAVATNIGRGVGVAFQLYLLFSGKGILHLNKNHFAPLMELIRRLIKVASGGAGQYVISSASWVFLMRIISNFGTEVVAGYTITIRVIIFAILPAFGMANAAATLVGQNLGANRPDRAEQAAWRTGMYCTIFFVGVSILSYFLAPYIIGVFDQGLEATKAGITSLRIICAGYITFGYGMVLSQSLNGAGDTRTPTIINFAAFWLVQIPLAYALAISLDIGPSGVYWAILITESVFATICILVFRRGKWKQTKI